MTKLKRLNCTLIFATTVLLMAACSTSTPTNTVASDGYPLNEWQLGFLREQNGYDLRNRPEVCGNPIPASEVTVLDVKNDANPRDVVRNKFPNADFIRDDYLLVAVQKTPAQTRKWLRAVVAQLGCDVLVLGDFENKRFTYDAEDPKLRTMTLQAIWGSGANGSTGP